MDTQDHCPVEATLELIGGKYKALILWHLSEKTLRFSQLHKCIPNITPKMLTQQLRELETDCLIHREVYPVIPPKVEYTLTEAGQGFAPILNDMLLWSQSALPANADTPTSVGIGRF